MHVKGFGFLNFFNIFVYFLDVYSTRGEGGVGMRRKNGRVPFNLVWYLQPGLKGALVPVRVTNRD
jgi:hypothetical protein